MESFIPKYGKLPAQAFLSVHSNRVWESPCWRDIHLSIPVIRSSMSLPPPKIEFFACARAFLRSCPPTEIYFANQLINWNTKYTSAACIRTLDLEHD